MQTPALQPPTIAHCMRSAEHSVLPAAVCARTSGGLTLGAMCGATVTRIIFQILTQPAAAPAKEDALVLHAVSGVLHSIKVVRKYWAHLQRCVRHWRPVGTTAAGLPLDAIHLRLYSAGVSDDGLLACSADASMSASGCHGGRLLRRMCSCCRRRGPTFRCEMRLDETERAAARLSGAAAGS